MSETAQAKQILTELYQVGLNAVNGQIAVEQQLLRKPIKGNIAIVAIGKAAAAMALGAKNQLNEQVQSALIITKSGYADSSLAWPCIEAGHPIPNKASLEAGAQLLKFIRSVPKETKLLALISGGASALVEVLAENMDLALLEKVNNWLLGSGLAIDEINHIRQSLSLIKGGKTLHYLTQPAMTQYLISDVKGDNPEIIGSGLFIKPEQNHSFTSSVALPDWLPEYIGSSQSAAPDVTVDTYIIASNEMACQAIIKKAKQSDYAVTYHGQTLYGDIFDVAKMLIKKLENALTGVHIWGGETTVALPAEPGRGGRNQSLALALACALKGVKGLTLLVGATDGSDGPTDDAGAIIDATTVARGENETGSNAEKYLAAADAGTFLAAAGDLLSTGPTGTNVMDIVIAIKEPI